ncbi:MAG: hypothetical protein HYR91_13740 [Flavobacteriia bacterium]|nr:hypothetical protein [Flavobacteriia bacterium]
MKFNNSFIDAIELDENSLTKKESFSKKVLPFAQIKFINNSLIEIELYSGFEICENKVEQLIQECLLLTENKPALALIRVGEYVTFSPKAMTFSATPEGKKACIAEAYVINNLGHQIIGNIYLKVYRPAKPVNIFRSEIKAKEWLNTFHNN